MSDRDNITLPREVVKLALEALEWSWGGEPMGTLEREAITALRTHLAAEQPKPEPVAWMDRFGGVVLGKGPYETFTTPLYTFPPDAPTVKESLTHPGYVIGSHWLETAYSRICAGEAEADVLRDIGLVRITDGTVQTADIHAIVDRQEALRRDAERFRWLREWLDNNGLLVRAIRGESLAGYEHPDIKALRRDAERYRWLRENAAGFSGKTLDAAIDAAMKEGT